MGSYIEQLKRQFPTETAFQMALFSYVYNGKYKEELQTIKDLNNCKTAKILKLLDIEEVK